MRTLIAGALAALIGIAAVRAEPSDVCAMPNYLLFGDVLLERVTAAAEKSHQLKIVVFGTTSSTLPGPNGAREAYPARLEAALGAQLPGLKIKVISHARPRQPAAKMLETFDKVLQDEKPNLVIWQTGTFDAMQGIDPKEFLATITDGVEKLKDAGVDVILVNMQYNPRTESMIALDAYAENMRWVARERHVPLFDRLSIMRYWNDSGAIDLYAATKDMTVAKRVHDCIGRALATLIIDAGRLNAPERKTAR